MFYILKCNLRSLLHAILVKMATDRVIRVKNGNEKLKVIVGNLGQAIADTRVGSIAPGWAVLPCH